MLNELSTDAFAMFRRLACPADALQGFLLLDLRETQCAFVPAAFVEMCAPVDSTAAPNPDSFQLAGYATAANS